jgi:thiol-disulfide isomerase/thioredoxin
MKNAKYMFLGLAVILAILFLVRYHFYSKEAGFEGTNSFTLYYAEWCPHCKAVKPVFHLPSMGLGLIYRYSLEA